MIRPELQPIPDDLRQQWNDTRNIRIDDFLDADFAAAVLTALREVPHTFAEQTVPDLKFQYGIHRNYPDVACDHTLCILNRGWYTDVLRWVVELAGHPLAPPTDGTLISTHYGKGSYLDPHNDKGPTRRIAFILGFTPETWPAEHGGHLEFLDGRDGDVFIRERRAPGFNTLDLFDVQQEHMTHQVPLLLDHYERRAVSGWFHTVE